MADLKISALTAATTPLAGTEVLPIVQSSTTVKVAVSNLTAGRSVSSLNNNITGNVAAVDFSAATSGLIFSGGSDATKYAGTVLKGANSWNTFFGKIPDAVGDNVAIGNDALGSYGNTVVFGANDVTVSRGNLVIGTSGKGIDFSATSGTGVSELLADYEEGTFTPVISGNPTPGAATYTRQLGTYVKVGRTVWFTISCAWTAHTGGTNITVTGLPFVSSSTNNAPTAFSVFAGDYALTALNVMVAYIVDNSSTVVVQQIPVGGGSLTNVALDTSASILISGTYYS
jgi:hypothetical protein